MALFNILSTTYILANKLLVAPGVTYWKPLMEQACAESKVPCHFIDLAPLFEGHSEYMGSDGIHPSSAGGKVVADAVRDALKKYVYGID
jgi:lysophospholipase L1-like esterase